MNFIHLIKQSFVLRLSLILTFIASLFFITSIIIIKPITAESQEKRAILNSRENIQLNFEQVLDLYTREYKTLREDLNKLLPPKDNIIEIINIIETAGTKIGIKTKINNIPIPLEDPNSSKIRYLISFSSNNEQLISYLNELNQLDFYVEVQKVSSIKITEFTFDKLANHQVVIDVFTR